MSHPRPATVRFYVDADVLGLAKIVCPLRSDMTYPSDQGAVIKRRRRPACPITKRDTQDSQWIPVVAERGWLIITRDRQIQHHRAEIAAVKQYSAKMVTFSGVEAVDPWAQLEVLMCQWRAVDRLADEPGPFIYTLTRSTLRPVSLE